MEKTYKVRPSSRDEERGVKEAVPSVHVHESNLVPLTWTGKLGRISKKLDSIGVEARGIERVLPEERSPQGWLSLTLIWASAGLTLGTFATGVLGPVGFNLTLGQGLGITWGAGALGSFCSAYVAIYGKRNGLRSLVNSRYAFGYYGAMVMSALNVFTEVVFGVMDVILGGQALNTISRNNLPTAAGCVIIGVVSWVIATGGYKFIHNYSKYAVIFPFMVFIVLYSVGGDKFTNAPAPEKYDSATQSGLILSYIAVVFGSSSGWVAVAADYYIYYPESTPDWKIFSMSFMGLWIMPSFAISCGVGFGSILNNNADWMAIYEVSESTTDIMNYSMEYLGNVRYFFIFILAWSMISNNILNLYSISISMALFGDWTEKIPRFVWAFFASVLTTVLGIVGRNSFYSFLSNMVAVVAYWTMIYFAIFYVEVALIRKKIGWDLDGWDDRTRLSPGYAAGFAFCVGAAGAIVGMGETWYTGPIAALVGDFGGDLGMELGFAWAGIVYPPLRLLEVKYFGR
ncbi:cytosine-purine permease [Saccharata proteae CBS 121410]|uniref:Cytosine-purine permease n=1 Tax=Saccharata proteae CBS 121410 TaxID=1314787 RepID=A0A9P4I2C1_9PEZI|nr:cytosine-purine permease [Saccharata proteae CBS 121410]